ncbi:MAG: hypothetical protein BGO87_11745 [Flavobacteriia bacterium 40-80]|nr:MAG: hypothetical protein BGO87_11745 [Flavobacteriia bacterium 40-80]
MDKISPDKGETLKSLFQTFVTGINNIKATAPRHFLDSIGLDFQKLHLGFNSGQFHHRKDNSFKAPFIELGILTKSDAPVRDNSMTAYTVFGDYSIIFPLKDKNGNITNFYAHRFKIQTPKGEYLNNEGIYPCFPSKRTTRLFLTENVIDSATLIQAEVLENRDAVIALRNGELTDDIKKAIEQLAELTQILVIGKEVCEVLIEQLKSLTTAQIVYAVSPLDSLNEFWLNHGTEGLLMFLEEIEPSANSTGFQMISDQEFFFKGQEVSYHIRGVISQNTTLLELDFEIEVDRSGDVLRDKFDLLKELETKKKIYFWTENNSLNSSQIILELKEIKAELDKVRREQGKPDKQRGFSTKQDKLAKQLLMSKDLFGQLNELIGKAGIVGEEKSRLLLYLISSSYKFKYNLHAVIHSEDMTTGSELATKIAGLIPETEQYYIDITSSRTFRYYGNSKINNKLILIPDYSGVTSSKAINDLKCLQAKGQIISDAPTKGDNGEVVTNRTEVNGHSSSIGACKNSKKYFEGQPRTVLVSMDNSSEQMQRLMEYDCLSMSGQIDEKAEEQAKELLQYIIRNIHPLEVINPHASALMLPLNVTNARMLTLQLNCFVSLVALFRQHQRGTDKQGRIVVTKEDIQTGLDLYLDALMVTIDELDAGTRDFFDKLKVLMMSQSEKEQTKLTSLDIQKALGISKSHTNRFLSILLDHEYVQKEGHRNQGFSYVVTNWDESNTIKQMILERLATHHDPNTMGHQNTDRH